MTERMSADDFQRHARAKAGLDPKRKLDGDGVLRRECKTEADVSKACIDFLRVIGWRTPGECWEEPNERVKLNGVQGLYVVLSEPRRTKITPGAPDLLLFDVERKVMLGVELKDPGFDNNTTGAQEVLRKAGATIVVRSAREMVEEMAVVFKQRKVGKREA